MLPKLNNYYGNFNRKNNKKDLTDDECLTDTETAYKSIFLTKTNTKSRIFLFKPSILE